VIILSWDGLELTRACVESLRRNTESKLEVIVVDNGSRPEVQAAIPALADRSLLNPENRGFAIGMNQGLDLVDSPVVVFSNNDTVFPAGWDRLLLETLAGHSDAGIVVPAVTASGNPRTLRDRPGAEIERLLPFAEPPSGIVYLMRTETVRGLGGWSTDYPIASGEDWDLCFTIWTNGLEIYYDQRVLVEHVSKGTAAEKLGDWRTIWRANRNLFLEKWSTSPPAARMGESALTARRQEELRVVIEWMSRFYHTRDELLASKEETAELERQLRTLRKANASLAEKASLSVQLRAVPRRLRRKSRHLARRLLGSDAQQSQGPGDNTLE
jgi:GT2 family glycosyltransferase